MDATSELAYDSMAMPLISQGSCTKRSTMYGFLFPLFLITSMATGQTNCPTPDHNAPAPLALVSSPLIRVRPPLSQSVLNLPARVHVYVKASLKPSTVELWTGPTGTEVAEFYCRLASNCHPVLTGKYMRFSFVLTSCKQVGMVLEPRLFVRDKTQPLSVYEGPFECKEKTENKVTR